jgi:hypothetical protein
VVLVEVVGDEIQASDGKHGGQAGGEEENDQRDEMVRDEKGGVRGVRGWKRGEGSERVYTARSFFRCASSTLMR